MHTLILNRNFELPADGWYHIAPLGEFPHAAAGVVQVIDPDACRAIVIAFRDQAAKPNFPGLLIDFDHFSLDRQKPSEAAGWISDVQFREPSADLANSAGLWALIRWSDRGEEAVKGGRYRFLSPVWSRDDCQAVAGNRLRPVRLMNAAVTNDPNLNGLRPLSNRTPSATPQEPAMNDAVKTRLIEFLGLTPDATDDAILQAMEDVMSADEVAELQNTARGAQANEEALLGALEELEGELANRDIERYADRIPEPARDFWRARLIENRTEAVAALEAMLPKAPPPKDPTKPLHNRAATRTPASPLPQSRPGGEARARRIMNRAQEMRATTGMSFLAAFRAAEKETQDE